MKAFITYLFPEITNHQFGFILFIRNESLCSTTQAREVRLYFLKTRSKNLWTYFKPPYTIVLENFSSFCYYKSYFQNIGFLFYFLIVYCIVYILFLWKLLPFIHSKLLWLLSLIYFLLQFIFNIILY